MSHSSDYPLASSDATKMLAAGIERATTQRGATQREIAKQLNYKTSVMLSHMALGRVPIPIDKAQDIAGVLGLDANAFLIATLKQRHPEINFDELFGVQLPQESALANELEAIADTALDELPNGTKQVLREVAASSNPSRRWLTSAELPIMDMLRRRFPLVHHEGLPLEDSKRLAKLIEQIFNE